MRIEGRERIRAGETYVMVANHLSLLDILVLFRLFTHFKWVSKIENFRVPFIGWNMSLNRYVKLRRGDRASVVQMMKACRETLASGSSIMMFPEGTRSPDGRMRSFKTGAFELALECRRPILPIVHPRHRRRAAEARLRAAGPPPDHDLGARPELPYESFAGESAEELTQRVRALIAARVGDASASSRAA